MKITVQQNKHHKQDHLKKKKNCYKSIAAIKLQNRNIELTRRTQDAQPPGEK